MLLAVFGCQYFSIVNGVRITESVRRPLTAVESIEIYPVRIPSAQATGLLSTPSGYLSINLSVVRSPFLCDNYSLEMTLTGVLFH